MLLGLGAGLYLRDSIILKEVISGTLFNILGMGLFIVGLFMVAMNVDGVADKK